MRIFIFIFFTTFFSFSTANATNYYKRIVNDQYLGKICIGFTNTVNTEWNSVLLSAVSNYNSAFKNSTKLGLCYNPYISANIYNETFEIRIDVKNFGNTGWDGKGSFPNRWSKKPGKKIFINTYSIYKLDYNEKIALVMHEIGHNIGICHTDSPRGCSPIPGTNSLGKSLFRDQTGDNSYKYPSFSSNDKKAIRYMY